MDEELKPIVPVIIKDISEEIQNGSIEIEPGLTAKEAEKIIDSSSVSDVMTVPVTCGRCNKPKGETDECCKCGRPTKYTNDEEMCAKVEEYLKENQDSETITELGQEKLTVKLPTIEGLAVFIGVRKQALYDWAEKHEKFSDSLELVKQEQQKRVINKGLSGQYNSTIAKLILSANHGMREKSDVTTDDKPIEGIAVSFVKPK